MMTNNHKIHEEYSWAVSRLISKSVRIISESYSDIGMIDLLMALPVRPIFKEIKLSEMKDKNGNQLTIAQTAIGGYITRDTEKGNPNRLIVHLTFSKDVDLSWEEFFNKLLHSQGSHFQNMVAFIYLHEAMHIMMRHFDFYLNRSYYAIIEMFRPDLDDKSKSELLNYAFDYWINAYLIEEANPSSGMGKFREDPDFSGLYDPNLSPKQLSQQEIVIKLAKEAKIDRKDLTDTNGDIWGQATTITINGSSRTTVSLTDDHTLVHNNEDDAVGSNTQEISEVLDNTRRSLLDKTRGTGSEGSFVKLGVDYTVPLDWFKLLKSSVFTLTQKFTNNYDQTWGKLKNKMRHISPMPGRIHYDKEMASVISIDQSGSMSNDDLEKINYVVTELAKKSKFVEILLHDTSVVSRKRFIGKRFAGIREFITNRVACGGTSHKEVFDILDEIRLEKPSRKLIYMSFSDNHSDIEEVYDESLFSRIPTYWIITKGGRKINVPGMQISLEDGLLQS